MFTRTIVSLYPDIIVFGNYVFFSFYFILWNTIIFYKTE